MTPRRMTAHICAFPCHPTPAPLKTQRQILGEFVYHCSWYGSVEHHMVTCMPAGPGVVPCILLGIFPQPLWASVLADAISPTGCELEQLLRASRGLQFEVPLPFPSSSVLCLCACVLGLGKMEQSTDILRLLAPTASVFSVLPHQVQWL